MRTFAFLRTPVRTDHQGRMQTLVIDEDPLAGDPAAANPYPQTLSLTFQIAAGTTEVQIALPWMGMLYFLPDSTVGYPTSPSSVSEAAFAGWPALEGDLVLESSCRTLDDAFAANVPLVDVAPEVVRFSKVRITRDFLFTALRSVSRPILLVTDAGPTVLTDSMPLWLETFIYYFLTKRAGVWALHHENDATKDFAAEPMPSIALQPAGTVTTFRIAMASRPTEALEPDWYSRKGDFDDLSGETIVDPTIDSDLDQYYNPKHPIQSVIPPVALYQSALASAYTSDHASCALRPLLATLRSAAGTPYRRIDLSRPPRPGTVTTAYPQRPFPAYQVNWKHASDSSVQSTRMPLSGRLYLPLADDTLTIWVIKRSQVPAVATPGNEVKVSIQQPGRRYIDLPASTVDISILPGSHYARVYTHLFEYDAARTWAVLFALRAATIGAYQKEAERRWNAKILNWYIYRSAAMRGFAAIYAHFIAAAGRHGLAPEFLHAVVMGEGLGDTIGRDGEPDSGDEGLIERLRQAGSPYVADQIVDGWFDLGLDDIQSDLSTMISAGYLDGSSFSSSLINLRPETNEVEETKYTADVKGWEASIELIAAELQMRKDWMLAYASSKGVTVSTEDEIRFLSYVRYNSSIAESQKNAEGLKARLKKWVDPRPSDNSQVHYNAIQRVAIAQWYEATGAYR